MNLLHLDSSALGASSATRELSAAIAQSEQAVHTQYRDLDKDPIAHLTGWALSGQDPEAKADGERVMEQFLWADTIVIGAPMYNFTVPSTLKAWIDRIAIAGKTFRYTEKGPEGLAGAKRVIIASARGGVYGADNEADFQEAYLRQVFSFLGVKDIAFVRAEGVAYSPEHRQKALDEAKAGLPVATLPV